MTTATQTVMQERAQKIFLTDAQRSPTEDKNNRANSAGCITARMRLNFKGFV